MACEEKNGSPNTPPFFPPCARGWRARWRWCGARAACPPPPSTPPASRAGAPRAPSPSVQARAAARPPLPPPRGSAGTSSP
eukprot:1721453-Pyramimonas_sp.AAC.1